ncbi:hypothetical protein [Pseudomonas nitroreducens]|uniref:hypothetical protein n=1 Tax=Pseudomonas nitroreducens TaxID=46680 RepID=UPI001FB77A8F|nr:hypothetical protein [Pseudomonas nitroreducens]MCJ1881131.1 hypothetical protein [Pseudomonas nitroreducens]MCJ1895809.1 hypothetical protein [Pseudomonas nitroreducens]
MTYFIINIEHKAIVGLCDVTYTSFTNRFHKATEFELARYCALSELLPADTYLQLSDLVSADKKQPVKESKHKSAKASPEFRDSIANMFKSKPREGK